MTAEPSSPPSEQRKTPQRLARRLLRVLSWCVVVVLVVVLAAWLLLQTGWARDLVRRQVVAVASEALAREVAIDDLHFDLVPPSVEVVGLTVAGTDGLGEPLATVQRLAVRAGTGLVGGLLRHRPITLAEVIVEEPRVSIVFHDDGTSNLPDLPESEADAEDGLEVRIERLHLTDGVFLLEEQTWPLDFSAEGLRASLREVEDRDLLLRADSDRLRAELLEGVLTASASVQALVAEGGVELQHARLRSENLAADVGGSYRDDLLELELEASADLALLGELGFGEPVQGSLSVDGTLEVRGEEWSAGARAVAPEIALPGLSVAAVELELAATASDLQVGIRNAEFAGGRVQGTAEVPLDMADAEISLDLTVEGIDLATVLSQVEAPVAGLEGLLGADAEYRFSLDQPLHGRGRAELSVTSTEVSGESAGSWTLPLDGRVPVVVENGLLRIEEATLTAPGQLLTARGDVELETGLANFDFRLETEDPRAALRVLPAIYENDDSPIWEPSRGIGTLAGSLQIQPPGFSTSLDLTLDSAVVTDYMVPRIEGSLQIDSGGIQEIDLDLRRGEAAIEVMVSLPFEGAPPGFTEPEFAVRLDLERWDVGSAEPWIEMEIPFSGLVSGWLEVGGDLEALVGVLEARVDDLAVEGFEVPGRISGRIEFDPDRTTVGPLRHSAPAGDLELAGKIETATGALDLRLVSSPLELAAPPFDDWTAGYLAGTAEIEAEIAGTLESPDLRGTLVGSGLALESGVLGDGGDAQVDLSWSDGVLAVSGSLLGLLSLEGGGILGEAETDLEIRLRSEAVPEILELVLGQVPPELAGRFEGVVLARSSEDIGQLEVRLDDLELSYLESRLSAVEPVVMTVGESGARLESFYLTEAGTGSEIFVMGDLGSSEDEMDLRIASSIDAGWLSLYLPDFDLSGRLDLLAVVRGTPENPRLDGQGEMRDGRLIISGFPHAIEQIHGFLFLYPERAVIDSGQARFAGGELLVEGEIGLAQQEDLSYELRFAAKDVNVRYPEDWLFRGDAQLVLTETSGGRLLTGTVELESAAFVKEFQLGFTQLVRSLFQRRPELVEETDEMLVGTRVNIAVLGPDALHLKTDLAELRGDIDLTVRGNLAAPVLLGEISLARGGEISLGNTEYRLERGTLTFANPFRNDVQVDLVASANVQAYEVQLSVFGPADDLETALSSNPPMSNLDIISLLTTGSVDLLGQVGSGEVATGESSGTAEAFLAGQAASLAGQRVGSFIGLDQVQISPLTGGSADLSAARITVGRRISRDVFVTYSYDPSESEEGIFELRWQIYPSISLILTRSDDGSVAGDIRWDTTF